MANLDRFRLLLGKPGMKGIIKDLMTQNVEQEELEQRFSRMTDTEFNTLGGVMLDYVCDANNASLVSRNFGKVVTLHFGFAKYALEAANFQEGMKDSNREAMEGMAKAYQMAGEALEELSEKKERVDAYRHAWRLLTDRCEKYGYKSGGVYEQICTVRDYNFFRAISS